MLFLVHQFGLFYKLFAIHTFNVKPIIKYQPFVEINNPVLLVLFITACYLLQKLAIDFHDFLYQFMDILFLLGFFNLFHQIYQNQQPFLLLVPRQQQFIAFIIPIFEHDFKDIIFIVNYTFYFLFLLQLLLLLVFVVSIFFEIFLFLVILLYLLVDQFPDQRFIITSLYLLLLLKTIFIDPFSIRLTTTLFTDTVSHTVALSIFHAIIHKIVSISLVVSIVSKISLSIIDRYNIFWYFVGQVVIDIISITTPYFVQFLFPAIAFVVKQFSFYVDIL